MTLVKKHCDIRGCSRDRPGTIRVSRDASRGGIGCRKESETQGELISNLFLDQVLVGVRKLEKMSRRSSAPDVRKVKTSVDISSLQPIPRANTGLLNMYQQRNYVIRKFRI